LISFDLIFEADDHLLRDYRRFFQDPLFRFVKFSRFDDLPGRLFRASYTDSARKSMQMTRTYP